MIDDEAHKEEWRYMPGDLVGLVFPYMRLTDVRVKERYLSPRQLEELADNLVCSRCGRTLTCTCEVSSRRVRR